MCPLLGRIACKTLHKSPFFLSVIICELYNPFFCVSTVTSVHRCDSDRLMCGKRASRASAVVDAGPRCDSISVGWGADGLLVGFVAGFLEGAVCGGQRLYPLFYHFSDCTHLFNTRFPQGKLLNAIPFFLSTMLEVSQRLWSEMRTWTEIMR